MVSKTILKNEVICEYVKNYQSVNRTRWEVCPRKHITSACSGLQEQTSAPDSLLAHFRQEEPMLAEKKSLEAQLGP